MINISLKPKEDLLTFSNIETFIKNRHSIREYKNELVDESIIKKIISLAQNCPSACNRQSCKVYYTTDNDKSEKLRKLNTQKSGNNIFNYMVVCINGGDYSPMESFQSYVDGGIFLQSLSMAIHGMGLGSCLFQTAKGSKRYDNYKKILGIKSYEDIICVVGYGYLKDTVKYIETHRKDIDDVAVCVSNFSKS